VDRQEQAGGQGQELKPDQALPYSGAPNMQEIEEGRTGIARVEAFSDGVIAIIITIMVLELHAPVEGGLEHLTREWPTFLAYMLSYGFVAIYWVNHHRLFSHALRNSNALMWSNILLLFTLSLVPFSTAYLGEHHFGRTSTLIYLATVLLPSIAYTWLQATIRKTGRQDEAARQYHLRTTRKGFVATALYTSGVALTFVASWLGIGCAVIVAILWFLPDSPFDKLFDGRGGQRAA
jgi:uncharacterized membrane protein